MSATPASPFKSALAGLGLLPKIWLSWLASRLSHFRRNWYLWAVLFYATNMKSFVNELEGAFARSLTVCSARCEYGEYSGSKWCGDRLEVVDAGARLAAHGVGAEDFATKGALFFFFLVSGVWGPRPCLLIGFAAIGASCAIFALACSQPHLGKELYLAAQHVQGLNPAFYLQSLVTMYICCQPDGDWRINTELGMALGLLSMRFRRFTSIFLEALELSDYASIWWSIALLNFSLLVLTCAHFPYITLVAPNLPEGSFLWKLLCEAWSYRSIVLDWRLRRYVLRDFLDGFCVPIHYYMELHMVLRHGWSPSGVAAALFLTSSVRLFATPLYWKGVDRFGHYQTFMFVFRALHFIWMFGFFLGPLSDKSVILIRYLIAFMEGGFGAERHFLDAKFADWDGLLRAGNVVWIVGLFQASWSFQIYDSLFHSASESYWSQARFILLHSAVCAARYVFSMCALFDVDGVRGFGVSLRALDSAKARVAELWQELAGAEGSICAIKYELCELDAHLGVPFAAAPGPIRSVEGLRAAASGLGGTPERDQEALQVLAAAVASARGVPRLLASCAEAVKEAQAAQWWWPTPPPQPGSAAPSGHEEWSASPVLRAARLDRPRSDCFPELQGLWVPAWQESWTYPDQAWNDKTVRQFDHFGRATFFYGPSGEYGTIAVAKLERDGLYAVSMQVDGGHYEGGAQLDDMIVRLQPDGSMTVVSAQPPVFEYWERRAPAPENGALAGSAAAPATDTRIALGRQMAGPSADGVGIPVPDSPIDTPEDSEDECTAAERERVPGDSVPALNGLRVPGVLSFEGSHPSRAVVGPASMQPDGGSATLSYGAEGEQGHARVTARTGNCRVTGLSVDPAPLDLQSEQADPSSEVDVTLTVRIRRGSCVEFWARADQSGGPWSDSPAGDASVAATASPGARPALQPLDLAALCSPQAAPQAAEAAGHEAADPGSGAEGPPTAPGERAALELAGAWLPARPGAWSRPHQARHAATSLHFEEGLATLYYGPEGEHGFLRVTGRAGSGYVTTITINCGQRSSRYEDVSLCLEDDGVLAMRTRCGGHMEFWGRTPWAGDQAEGPTAQQPPALHLDPPLDVQAAAGEVQEHPVDDTRATGEAEELAASELPLPHMEACQLEPAESEPPTLPESPLHVLWFASEDQEGYQDEELADSEPPVPSMEPCQLEPTASEPPTLSAPPLEEQLAASEEHEEMEEEMTATKPPLPHLEPPVVEQLATNEWESPWSELPPSYSELPTDQAADGEAHELTAPEPPALQPEPSLRERAMVGEAEEPSAPDPHSWLPLPPPEEAHVEFEVDEAVTLHPEPNLEGQIVASHQVKEPVELCAVQMECLEEQRAPGEAEKPTAPGLHALCPESCAGEWPTPCEMEEPTAPWPPAWHPEPPAEERPAVGEAAEPMAPDPHALHLESRPEEQSDAALWGEEPVSGESSALHPEPLQGQPVASEAEEPAAVEPLGLRPAPPDEQPAAHGAAEPMAPERAEVPPEEQLAAAEVEAPAALDPHALHLEPPPEEQSGAACGATEPPALHPEPLERQLVGMKAEDPAVVELLGLRPAPSDGQPVLSEPVESAAPEQLAEDAETPEGQSAPSDMEEPMALDPHAPHLDSSPEGQSASVCGVEESISG